MIESGAPGRHLSLNDPVRWTAAQAACSALDDPVRASGLISPVNALVVQWPLLIVFFRMILSRALHGLVPAWLQYHGLVRVFASLHHRGLLLLAASLLLQGCVPLGAAPHPHGLVHLFTLLHHHGLVLPMVRLPLRGLALISACLLYHGLVLTTASLHLPASSTGLFRCFTTALSSSLLPCVSSAWSSCLHHCICLALSFAFPPDLTPSLHHLALGLLFPSPLATIFPWTLLPWGWGPLLVLPPRAILPWGFWPLFYLFCPGCSCPGHLPATCPSTIESWVRWLLLPDPPRMSQSGAPGRPLSPDDPVRGAAAPAA